MITAARCCLWAALLAAGEWTVQAANRQYFFTAGGSVELRPAQAAGDIKSVSWKHNGDLVAEWVKDVVDLEFHGVLLNRASMDEATAVLRITNMTEQNKGVYTVEINDRLLGDQHEAVFLKVLRDVVVEVRPLTCSHSNEACSLICHSDLEGVGSVTYHWKEGEMDWVEGKLEKEITNTKAGEQPENFSCRIQNLVSKKDSEPFKNPFREKPTPGPHTVGEVIGYSLLGLVLFLGLLALLALLLFLLRNIEPFSEWWSWLVNLFRREPEPPQTNGAAAREPHSPDDPAAEEMVSISS